MSIPGPEMNRREKYEQLVLEMPLLIGSQGKYQTDLIGKMALFCAALKRQFSGFIFIGFYIVKEQALHIGPYQGEIIACTPIPFDSGVCGTAAGSGQTLIVDDVCDFPGYIACDGETKSEIVVPVFKSKQLIAVLDIDSPETAAFGSLDRHYLEMLLKLSFSSSTA